jgi:hypothetical protein
MPVIPRVTDRTHPRSAAIASVLVACMVFCSFGGSMTVAASPKEVTLRLMPLKAAVRQGEAIELRVVFVGGADETTLILPMGADPSGIITCGAIEIASGRQWSAADRDPRSFAADSRRRLPAGGSIKLHRYVLGFEAPGDLLPASLPAGRYRIVCTYDEGRTFSPENRTSRLLRSEPVEIVVTAP